MMYRKRLQENTVREFISSETAQDTLLYPLVHPIMMRYCYSMNSMVHHDTYACVIHEAMLVTAREESSLSRGMLHHGGVATHLW